MIAIPAALALHMLGAIVWVGGMFFAHMALRPAMIEEMDAEHRLRLWRRILPRFFAWVWLSVVVLLLTGYGVVWWGYGGLGSLPLHVDIMQGTGLLMVALYLWMYFGAYRRFRAAMARGETAAAGAAHARIRGVVMVNLALGLFTSAIGGTGPLWG